MIHNSDFDELIKRIYEKYNAFEELKQLKTVEREANENVCDSCEHEIDSPSDYGCGIICGISKRNMFYLPSSWPLFNELTPKCPFYYEHLGIKRTAGNVQELLKGRQEYFPPKECISKIVKGVTAGNPEESVPKYFEGFNNTTIQEILRHKDDSKALEDVVRILSEIAYNSHKKELVDAAARAISRYESEHIKEIMDYISKEFSDKHHGEKIIPGISNIIDCLNQEELPKSLQKNYLKVVQVILNTYKNEKENDWPTIGKKICSITSKYNPEAMHYLIEQTKIDNLNYGKGEAIKIVESWDNDEFRGFLERYSGRALQKAVSAVCSRHRREPDCIKLISEYTESIVDEKELIRFFEWVSELNGSRAESKNVFEMARYASALKKDYPDYVFHTVRTLALEAKDVSNVKIVLENAERYDEQGIGKIREVLFKIRHAACQGYRCDDDYKDSDRLPEYVAKTFDIAERLGCDGLKRLMEPIDLLNGDLRENYFIDACSLAEQHTADSLDEILRQLNDKYNPGFKTKIKDSLKKRFLSLLNLLNFRRDKNEPKTNN